MTKNTVEIEKATTEFFSENKTDSYRFIVFVAGGKRPVISFENFARAERLALLFANLAQVRMEVFDSEKEICYFVEPFECAVRSFIKNASI